MTATAQLLKSARLDAKLSQLDIAREFKLTSAQFVSNVERSLVLLPPEMFRKISALTNVPAEKFLQAYMKDVELKVRKKAKLTPRSKAAV